MFDDFDESLTDTVTLIKPNGKKYEDIKASVQTKKIFINDATLPIEEGDIIERVLPNKLVENYEVVDRGYNEEWEGIPAHYQIDVRKQTNIEVNRPTIFNNTFNPTLNINQHQVQNMSISVTIYNEIINKIDDSALQQLQKDELKALIKEIETEAKKAKPRWEKVFEGAQKAIKFGLDIAPSIIKLLAASQ